MTSVITRANTVSFAFSFLDSTGAAASVASATLQLEYPGRDRRETEVLTLTENAPTWDVTWSSTKSRKGWVRYHAHAIDASGNALTEDGRFKLSANSANYQHDELPRTSSSDYDYSVEGMFGGGVSDYV